MSRIKDPVCGMIVSSESASRATHEGRVFLFCSEFCRRLFESNPGHYLKNLPADPSSGEPDPRRRVAYFSLEIHVDPRVPTYSGGLGVLAGDTLRSCADLRVPAVAISLLYRNGYFRQRLDEWGNQREQPVAWDPAVFARPLSARVAVSIEGRNVVLRAWRHVITGATGYEVPVLFLDADCEENAPADRELTAWLYGGDERYRLAQEVILGIGGVRMLRALAYHGIERFHMNEGHAALLVLELLGELGGDWDFEGTRGRCVFTTHTPVAAGHDQFAYDLVKRVVGDSVPLEPLQMLAGTDRLNMTLLALNASKYVNGVAKRHGEVSREMFAGYPIDSITNGVHSATWICESFARLYDRYVPGWANDPFALRYAISIPGADVWLAHADAKRRLVSEISRRTGRPLATESFTVGFARRATAYKRADLVLSDPEELISAARAVGPLQVVYAGKAHPRDEGGKDVIRRIFQATRTLGAEVNVVYVEDYDAELARLLTAGVDLWLNTPLRPWEASGTSGMKAAHNGVPSFSTLDGWWIEGHIEGVTGWSIGAAGADVPADQASREDAQDLYRKLRAVILPLFYRDRDRWIDVMRSSIAFNASFFNTHRMVQQYAANAYV